jgi:2-isopropylmalate synthase
MGTFTPFFDSVSYRVLDEKRTSVDNPMAEATVMIEVDGVQEHTAAEGNGPVNAIDNAIRKALVNFYPNLKDMELVDYKVRILTTGTGTEAVTRVLIESKDSDSAWGTVGVATNIVDASYQALMDSIEYKLLKDKEKED